MKLTVSSPPHWHGKLSESKLHMHIILALLPAVIYALFTYKFHAARVIALSVATAVITEYLICRLFKKTATLEDGSAILIGLLYALILPPSIPYWLIVFGAFLAIFIGKQIFGGLGSNPLNPTLVGWAICYISWPAYFNLDLAFVKYSLSFNYRYPLALLKNGGVDQIAEFTPVDLLLGRQVAGIGAAAVLFLIIGGSYLMIRKIIPWEIPAAFAVGLLGMSFIFWLSNPAIYASPLFHLLTGNAIIGIFFLSTDFASSPFNRWGMIIFGLSCGILTIILRAWSVYPDGVIFAIIIMNLATPLLDGIKKKPLVINVNHFRRGMK
jgi:electron transport complex protein RnfD